MKNLLSLFVIFILLLFNSSCRKDAPFTDNSKAYDIILVMGQSNTHYGKGIDSVLDASQESILQLGRFGANNYEIITAQEPLDHHTKKKDCIGFALTVAKLYAKVYLDNNHEVLIIPCGKAGSGFHNNKWNPGDILYNDAVNRAQHVLMRYPKSELKGILWHQGEDDVDKNNYQQNLDFFITSIRKDLGNPEIPFLLGGMVPAWVNELSERQEIQNIIADTPNRLENTAYVDPTAPILIPADTVATDIIHYTAAAQRELGARYFLAYAELIK